MVVAARLTGAPTASAMIRSASARRAPSLGRSPISCTATLAMSKPAARTRAAVSDRKAARGTGPLGIGGPVVATEITQASRTQQRVTGRMCNDITIGVAFGADLVVKEQQATFIGRPAASR